MAAAINADMDGASDAVPPGSAGKIGNEELDQSLKDWEEDSEHRLVAQIVKHVLCSCIYAACLYCTTHALL